MIPWKAIKDFQRWTEILVKIDINNNNDNNIDNNNNKKKNLLNSELAIPADNRVKLKETKREMST